jgi:hypothetical protein
LTLGDDSRVDVRIGTAYLELLGRGGVFPVAVFEIPEPIIGAMVPNGLGIDLPRPLDGKPPQLQGPSLRWVTAWVDPSTKKITGLYARNQAK